MQGGTYLVTIIRRDMQQLPDDYHATVKRYSDGVELIWTSRWRWLLEQKLTPNRIDKAFAQYDKRQGKLAEVKEFTI